MKIWVNIGCKCSAHKPVPPPFISPEISRPLNHEPLTSRRTWRRVRSACGTVVVATRDHSEKGRAAVRTRPLIVHLEQELLLLNRVCVNCQSGQDCRCVAAAVFRFYITCTPAICVCVGHGLVGVDVWPVDIMLENELYVLPRTI